ncbi:11527_t:CDS:2, partial [Scutellospora calospora]
YIAQDTSFYASLHMQPILQSQKILCTNNKAEILSDLLKTRRIEWKKPKELNKENQEIEEIDSSNFNLFLEEVRLDYDSADQLLRTALNKFKDRYNAA